MIANLFALGLITVLSLKGAEMQRADDIYTSGPETLIAESKVIVAGPVANFAKNVTQTDAASGTPLRWEIRGEIERPETLKGDRPPAPIHFTRAEQAVFMEQQPEPPRWASDYLIWEPADRAVIFFLPGGMEVYPSGSGERDLVSMVRKIIGIQALGQPEERFHAWSQALTSATMEAQKHAALRFLASSSAPWSELQPIFQRVMRRSDAQLRSFAFGLIAYHIRQARWPDPRRPAAFLCEQLQAETDPHLTRNYVAVFSLLVSFARQGGFTVERYPLAELLRACLAQKCKQSSGETADICRELLARFPQ